MKTLFFILAVKKISLICFLILFVTNSVSAQFEEQTGISLPEVQISSAAWGDYNNDGYLDLLLTGGMGSNCVSRIYKNNGDGTFSEQTGISLTGVYDGSVAWGDYNNDGYVDILLSGYSRFDPITKVYKNNGDGTFSEQTEISLTGVYLGSVAWGDYNNDGFLDILISGSPGHISTQPPILPISKVYKNNGDGTFSEQTRISVTGVYESSVAWGDYNNDGYLDILLTGRTSQNSISIIYKNNNDGTFSEQTGISLTEVRDRPVIWADYNNDGFLDILSSNVDRIIIYQNNGDGTFSEQTGISLPNYGNWVSWGDYNNDGFIDILQGGFDSQSYVYQNNGDGTFSEQMGTGLSAQIGPGSWADYNNDGLTDILIGSKIYKNVGTYSVNTVPTAPANLQQNINFNSVTLKWSKATDNQTPQNGLSYNIRVGTTPGGSNIVSPNASVNSGYRRILAFGNAGQTTDTFTLNLPAGTYYWSVQAIDNAFAGGVWATENTFVISSNQASDINIDSKSLNEIKLKWTNGNGDRRIVFMALGNQGMARPDNNISYLANNIFGLGEQINESGWFCVYIGTENKVTVTGLADGIDYSIAVLEYSGSAGNENYNTITSIENPIITSTETIFQEQSVIAPSDLYSSVAPWGDYNNDGFLDIMQLTGTNNIKIYKNNGNGLFSEQTGISIVGGGPFALGDYNNDGYLDILSTTGGYEVGPSDTSFMKLYKNKGDGSFSKQTEILLKFGIPNSVAWGDYDNDGFLDILLTGPVDFDRPFSKIYRNNGDGTFTEKKEISLTPVKFGSGEWADFNNDGYLDILLTGDTTFHGSVIVTKIYKNNGKGNFSELKGITLTGVEGSSVFGDYNNDGFLDILLNGFIENSQNKTIIYKNNGDDTFSEHTGISLDQVAGGSAVWGDYNNDGYLDILLTGKSGSNLVSKIYKNNGNDTFSEQTGIKLPLELGTAAWGDYDNDGLLDILIGSKVYKNVSTYPVNMVPSAPTNLQRTINFNSATLKWDKATDFQTPQNGLSYNIRVGTTPGGLNIVSPMALTSNGYRLKPAIGNSGQKNDGYIVRNLPAGTYYWSVQAIDNALAGGAWATESEFTITASQNSNVVADSTSLNGMKLRWTNGNGDGRVVFIAEGDKEIALPENSNTYKANNTFGLGTQLGQSDWYCINNGTENGVLVTGLKAGTNYKVAVFDYTGVNGSENYNVSIATGNVVLTKTKELFEEQASFSGEFIASKWGYYYNDSLLDIRGEDSYHNMCDYSTFENKGDGTFSNPIHTSSCWNCNCDLSALFAKEIEGDYDSDGYADKLIFRNDSATYFIPELYKNNGDGTFTKQTESFPSANYRYPSWGDYNNDGYLDLFLRGTLPSQELISKLYENNGKGTFVEQIGFSLKEAISATWGDYNNDGYIDLSVTYSGGIKIYKNNGAYAPYPKNTPPTAPTNLKQTKNFNNVILSWDKATDAQTSQNGLGYNIRIGTTPGSSDILNPIVSDRYGFRLLQAIGNAGQTDNYKINLPAGTYYWSVQALDNSFAVGEWANEKMINIPDTITNTKNIISGINFMIYPNPTKDYFMIICDKAEPYMITIVDLNGINVLSRQIKSNERIIHLNNLKTGLYIVKLQTNNEVLLSKLVVE